MKSRIPLRSSGLRLLDRVNQLEIAGEFSFTIIPQHREVMSPESTIRFGVVDSAPAPSGAFRNALLASEYLSKKLLAPTISCKFSPIALRIRPLVAISFKAWIKF
jgi:hypothetical protein